jgi:prepilin-type processing-associated H-X9-DG protein
LVELLIVLAIVVVLLSLLLPAIGSAREHAKRVRCMANLQQLTMAWLMYAGDNKGHFCSSEMQDVQPGQTTNFTGYSLGGVYPGSAANFFWSWVADGPLHHDIPRGVLWPYVKNLQVYYCPNDPILPNTVYAINGYLAGRVGMPKTLFTLSQVRRPEGTFVFIEAGPGILTQPSGPDTDDTQYDADDFGIPGYQARVDASFATAFTPARMFSQLPGAYHHMGTTNGTTISFADGHVLFWEYADPTRLAGAVDPTTANTASTDAPDLHQLEAWSGGPIPRGVTP